MARQKIKSYWPRMTFQLQTANHEYLKVMAAASGITMSDYVNRMIADERLRNPEMYEIAKKELADKVGYD